MAYARPSAITIEYTEDGGATWLDYGATDKQKKRLFLGNAISNIMIKRDSDLVANQNGLRITIDDGCGIYCYSTMAIIHHYFPSGVNVEIQGAMYKDPDTFVTLESAENVSGNPSYRVFRLDKFLWGNNQVKKLRFNFMFVGTKYLTSGHTVADIKIFSRNTYSACSTLAQTGHIYKFDENQNTTFPANVSATSFNGSAVLTGTPTAPTAADGTSTTQIATTEFVTKAITNALAGLDASEVKY